MCLEVIAAHSPKQSACKSVERHSDVCVVACSQALADVRAFVTQLQKRPLSAPAASKLLEEFRSRARALTLQQVHGFRWMGALKNEGLEAALEEMRLRVNGKLADRARDARTMLRANVQQEQGQVSLPAAVGEGRNASQATQEHYPEAAKSFRAE